MTEKSPQCSKETGVTYCLHIASKAAEEIMQIESDFRLSLLQQGRIVDNTDAAFRNPIGQKNEEELGRLEIKTVNQKKTIRRTYNKTLANASKPLPPTTTRAPPFPSFNLDATTSAFGEMKLEPRKLDRSKYNEKCDVMVLCLQCGVCVIAVSSLEFSLTLLSFRQSGIRKSQESSSFSSLPEERHLSVARSDSGW